MNKKPNPGPEPSPKFDPNTIKLLLHPRVLYSGLTTVDCFLRLFHVYA